MEEARKQCNTAVATMLSMNVNDKTEKKNGLTYLSWAWAWMEVLKIDKNATYNVIKFETPSGDRKPWIYDEDLGYMVFTEVTIERITREMWLPVMDGANKALKNRTQTIETKYGKKTIEAATMFDINKTIMRCLVKNLAMFGLGLYIYAGEDLPKSEEEEEIHEGTEGIRKMYEEMKWLQEMEEASGIVKK